MTERELIRSELQELSVEFLRSRDGVKWSRYPEPVLPAWVADMDFQVAPAIRRRLERFVSSSDFGYTWVPAPPELIDVFIERQKNRFGLDLETENVVTTVTALQGVDTAIQLFSEPGDGVVVQTPIYPPFLAAVASTGRQLVENPLAVTDSGYELDLDSLDAVIDERTRILLLCNPHNPTGRSFRRQELEALAERALRHDLTIISDEIHADLTHAPHRHTAFGSLAPEVLERTLTVTSATKAFNLAGLPCSFTAAGSTRLRDAFRSLPDHLLAHPGALDIAATQTAWQEGDTWLEEVLAVLETNRRRLHDRLRAELPQVRSFLPEATYLAWIDCNELHFEDRASKAFYKEGGLALHCGHDFGPPGSGCVRLNFATATSILDEMIDRLISVARAHSG